MLLHSRSIREDKLSRAEGTIREANALITQNAKAKPGGEKTKLKLAKDMIRTIFNAASEVIDIADEVADIHPAAKAAISLFKSLIQLETARRDNNEQIVAVCHIMTSMMHVLHHINQDLVRDTTLTVALDAHLDVICIIMHDFGDFSDLFYNKLKNPVWRFIRAKEVKRQLHGYLERLQNAKKELHFLLVVRNSSRSERADAKIHDDVDSIKQMISAYGLPANPREEEATQIIQRHGGLENVVNDKMLLTMIAALFDEKVTTSLQVLLAENIENLLNDNVAQFDLKLESARLEITEAIARAEGSILKRLDEGPHELIQDLDMAFVWQSNGWRLSVKCRTFVDGVCSHFDAKFRESAQENLPSDHWTLAILSKVAYHAAIGDAIDEDGSGFISVHELDHFLKRKPAQWTVAEWLVFWALGSRANDFRYAFEISRILKEIRSSCRETKTRIDDPDLRAYITGYLETISLLEHVIRWLDHFASGEGSLDDLDQQTSSKLQILSQEILISDDNRIEKHLKILDYVVTDEALLTTIVEQGGFRIEQWILCLLNAILREQNALISRAGWGSELTDQRWDEMDVTLNILFFAFHQRMKSLLRGWRSQKLDIELQIRSFTGGIFEGWFNAYSNEKSGVRKRLDKLGQREADDSDGSEADSSFMAQQYQSEKIEQLNTRVDLIDQRLENIQAMLGNILAAVNTTSPTQEKISKDTQGFHDNPKRRQTTDGYDLPGSRIVAPVQVASWSPYSHNSGSAYSHQSSAQSTNESYSDLWGGWDSVQRARYPSN